MSKLLLAVSLQTAKGDDSGLRAGLDPDQVTPGTLGFIMTLVMVIAVIVLMKSMSKRVRRVRYRSQVAGQGVFDQANRAVRVVPVDDRSRSGAG